MKNKLVVLLSVLALVQTSCHYFKGQGEWLMQPLKKGIMTSEYTLTIIGDEALINNSALFHGAHLGHDRRGKSLQGGECHSIDWRYKEENGKLFLYDLANKHELIAVGARMVNYGLKERINKQFDFEIDPLEFGPDDGIDFSETATPTRNFIFLNQNELLSFSNLTKAEITDIPAYVEEQKATVMESLRPYMSYYILADKKTPFARVKTTITSLREENCKVALLGISKTEGKEALHYIPLRKKQSSQVYLNRLQPYFK